MNFSNTIFSKWTIMIAVLSVGFMAACGDDSPVSGMDELRTQTNSYAFNEGQLLDDSDTAYRGNHQRNLSVNLSIEEMDNGNAAVTITLDNTVSGESYPVHIHDAADPSTTPNGTPYNESPNGGIFAGAISASGGSASGTNETSIAYDELINSYEGFLVVHDPLQELSTVDLTTYLVLGVFGQDLAEGESMFNSSNSEYAFNEGQLLDNVDTAYRGEHQRNLSVNLSIEEMENGNGAVTITLNNTVSGADYPVHIHDAADPATTPNGTPYNETPNGDIFAGAITGNGGTVSSTNETNISYEELTNSYEGFVVVHDPLQDVSTVDLTTYLILGVFNQSLAAGELNLRTQSFDYAFNEGQLLDDSDTAYGGDHPRNFSAKLMIEEKADGNATVSIEINNTLEGFDYPVHVHDAADPATTPNGTPYNETPNGDVFAGAIMGNGGTATSSSESTVPYLELVGDFEAFLVVHDPTQDISTVDLTTYLILGLFASDLEAGEPKLASHTFIYDFNEGQLLGDPDTAYEGDHARTLTAELLVEEQLDGTAVLTVTLNNTVDGEAYPVHSHDAADPSTTPNGTPYNETPNGDIFAQGITGNGGTVSASSTTQETLFRDLINEYEGFFVVHDPLQELSTVDLTTYVILGLTAR